MILMERFLTFAAVLVILSVLILGVYGLRLFYVHSECLKHEWTTGAVGWDFSGYCVKSKHIETSSLLTLESSALREIKLNDL